MKEDKKQYAHIAVNDPTKKAFDKLKKKKGMTADGLIRHFIAKDK